MRPILPLLILTLAAPALARAPGGPPPGSTTEGVASNGFQRRWRPGLDLRHDAAP